MKPQCTHPFSLLTWRPPLWLALSLALLLMVQPALAMAAQLPPAAPASDADLPQDLQDALLRAEQLTIDEAAISVEARADALGSEIEDLFAFVRDEIRFEPYRFLLRGPEGTLVAAAGNSVDQAYLLKALCRHHGLRCRVVQGTLSDEQAGSLIASLFSRPVPAELLEGIPEDAPKADPTRDPDLLAEVRDHYWVQWFDEPERRWIDLDPAIASSSAGEALTEANRIVTESPPELSPRLSLEVRLEEIKDGKTVHSTPLTFEESWSELVLAPVHLLNMIGREQLDNGTAVTGFQPILLIGDQMIEGQTSGKGATPPGGMGRAADLLESVGRTELQSEPLLLSREWIEFSLVYPDGGRESWSYEVFTELEDTSRWATMLVHLHLSAGSVSRGLLDSSYRALVNAIAQARTASAGLDLKVLESKNPLEDLTPYREAGVEVLEALATSNAHIALTHALHSDGHLEEMLRSRGALAYHARPRILISQSSLGEKSIGVSLDLARNQVRILLPPLTPTVTRSRLHLERGLWQSTLETRVLEELTGGRSSGAEAVLAAAEAQGIDFVMFTADELDKLANHDYSPTARRNMRASLEEGNVLLAPRRALHFEDRSTVAWWEIDGQTGEPVIVSENGRHGGVNYILVIKKPKLKDVFSMGTILAGLLAFFVGGGMAFINSVLVNVGGLKDNQTICAQTRQSADNFCYYYDKTFNLAVKDYYGFAGSPTIPSVKTSCQKGVDKILKLGCP